MNTIRNEWQRLPTDEKVWCVLFWACVATVAVGVLAIYVFGWRP